MEKIVDFLRDPVWQGIAAIIAILGVIFSFVPKTRKWFFQAIRNKWFYGSFFVVLTLILPIYVVSIISISIATLSPGTASTLVYRSALVSSTIGTIWGVIWSKYILFILVRFNKRGEINENVTK